MDQAQQQFLMLKRLPARLSVDQAAWLLGFQSHQIPLLISARLLKPLGHPSQNAPKYFSAVAIEGLISDSKWLEKASDETLKYWKRKNAARGKMRTGKAIYGSPSSERFPRANHSLPISELTPVSR